MAKLFQFSLLGLSEIFMKDQSIPGFSSDSFDVYKRKVEQRLAAYLFTVAHEKIGSNYLLAHKYNLSIRTIQRYQNEIDLPEFLLRLLYDLQN